MVLLIIIPTKNGYFIGGIPHFQTYPYEQTEQTKSSGLAISNESLATKREFIWRWNSSNHQNLGV